MLHPRCSGTAALVARAGAFSVCLALVACKKAPSPEPKPVEAPAPAPAQGFHVGLGDATVYELVNRKWEKVDPPARKIVLHADGTAEWFSDKTDAVMFTMTVKPDGTVTAEGKPMFTLGERTITSAMSNAPLPLTIDGDTISLEVNDKTVKVVLAADGNITVVDRPDGNKWRIEAKDPAVMRTAFRVLATQMESALD